MSKAQKILVGILTLVPFVTIPFFIIRLVFFILHMQSLGQDPDAATVVAGILSFILPIVLTSLLTLGLFIFYVVHTVNNRTIDTTEKVIWVIIFVFVGVIAFPIYWIMRVWNSGHLPVTTA